MKRGIMKQTILTWADDHPEVVEAFENMIPWPSSQPSIAMGPDEGRTWSKTVFDLNDSGMYASSVVLGHDTIVTAYAVERHSDGRNRLDVLRWNAPPRSQVDKNGFFSPRPAAIGTP